MDTILVTNSEVTTAVAKELEVIVEDTLRCTVGNDLVVSVGEGLVLSLVCDKED